MRRGPQTFMTQGNRPFDTGAQAPAAVLDPVRGGTALQIPQDTIQFPAGSPAVCGKGPPQLSGKLIQLLSYELLRVFSFSH
jgi:hypothetical protein